MMPNVSIIPPKIPYGGFPQYGFKAGVSAGAFPRMAPRVAPLRRRTAGSLHSQPDFIEPDLHPAREDFYYRAFDGLVTRPVAGYCTVATG